MNVSTKFDINSFSGLSRNARKAKSVTDERIPIAPHQLRWQGQTKLGGLTCGSHDHRKAEV